MDQKTGALSSDRALSIFPSVANRHMTFVLNVPDAQSECRLRIYDVRGRIVRDFGRQPAEHIITWDLQDDRGQNLPDGVYFVRLVTGNRTITDKAVIVRD